MGWIINRALLRRTNNTLPSISLGKKSIWNTCTWRVEGPTVIPAMSVPTGPGAGPEPQCEIGV